MEHYIEKHGYIRCHFSYSNKAIFIGFNNNQVNKEINSQSDFDDSKLIWELKQENSIVLFNMKKSLQDHKYAKSLNMYKYTIEFEIIPINEAQEIKEHEWSLDGSDETIITNSQNRKGSFTFAFGGLYKEYNIANVYKESYDSFMNVRIIVKTYVQ